MRPLRSLGKNCLCFVARLLEALVSSTVSPVPDSVALSECVGVNEGRQGFRVLRKDLDVAGFPQA